MLDIVFSEKFIKNMRKCTNYPFIIINSNGIIIAATEKDRIGIFHEASYRMMKERRQIAIVQPHDVQKYLGAKPGIDLPITYKNEVSGAIGITGNPQDVKPIVLIAKMFIETLLDYIKYKEKIKIKKSPEEKFQYLLLEGEEEEEEQELMNLVEYFNYKKDIFRIAVLFNLSDHDLIETVLEELKKTHFVSGQDIVLINNTKQLIIFKSLPLSIEELFSNYKELIEQVINQIDEFLIGYNITETHFVGSIQNKFLYYKYSYSHCSWMFKSGCKSPYFYDNIDNYLKSILPLTAYNSIYNIINDNILQSLKKLDYIKIIKSLKESNYNLNKASKKLYLHKNTLIFRFNKIKQIFNVNPIKNAYDKDFLDNLLIYIENLKK